MLHANSFVFYKLDDNASHDRNRILCDTHSWKNVKKSWLIFSSQQSGKLVMKMFQKIQELIDDPEAIVFVLIDEVTKG